MTQRHEIPTHLDTPDRILLGLTLRQMLVLAAGIATSFWLGNFLGWPLGFAIAAPGGLITFSVSFIKPGGRGLEDWALAIARYMLTPRIYSWRPGEGSGGVFELADTVTLSVGAQDDEYL